MVSSILPKNEQNSLFWASSLKFVFSKKATKNDEIFTVDLTLSSIFVAFLENMNFT